MQALVLVAPGEAPSVRDVRLREISAGEVRVRIAAGGVCHTDVSIRDGGLPAMVPCTLGHEAAGVVDAVGSPVAAPRVGDHVVLSWNVPCRGCDYCLRDEAALCPHGLDHAFASPYADLDGSPVWPAMGVGGFAEYTLVPAGAAIVIDPALPLEQAALLGCGVTTGVGAVLRTADVRAGQRVLVLGCGGVGLAAVQAARLAGAVQVIAADRIGTALDAAVRCGATEVIDTSGTDLAVATRELTGGEGVDHTIEVVGQPATVEAAYAATRRGGTVTVVGAGSADAVARFPMLSLMADAKTIRGSVYGATDPARDIPVLAELALRGALDLESLITRRIGLDAVSDSLDAMVTGQGGGRSVVVF